MRVLPGLLRSTVSRWRHRWGQPPAPPPLTTRRGEFVRAPRRYEKVPSHADNILLLSPYSSLPASLRRRPASSPPPKRQQQGPTHRRMSRQRSRPCTAQQQ
ncbi:hypothetical protein ACP70R_036220 [Stipagrostis hirtigluma subsp. patula]